MIRWLILIWLALVALPAGAAPVKVTSGEHEGFTRVVMEFAAAVDWTVGRTRDGYALQVAGQTPGYDLTRAFDLIGRGRLSAIWTDPASGELRLGIGCACHAIPFEFRPGIVVIDLRDGPPPQGSSFELALDGAAMPALAEATPVSQAKALPGYDWTQADLMPLAMAPAANAAPAPAPPPAAEEPQVLPLGDLALEPLREALLRQLSRGAAQGVVDMAEPPKRGEAAAADVAAATFRIGEQANISITGHPADDRSLTAQGAICVTDSQLFIETWADESPVSGQMGRVMTGLSGEFDHPDAEAVARAVRFNLSIGFGAEARLLLEAFPSQQPDAAVWTSMAHVLDTEPDPAPAFAGMLGCDTDAALWAVLGDPAPVRGDVVALPAVLRAFSALPLHLRRQLGPRLADRLLALDEADAAFSIQQAILRVSGAAGPEVALMEARIAAHGGDLAAAEATTGAVLDDPGPAAAKALVAMVELQAAQNAATDPATVTALAGYLTEQGDGPLAADLSRALILAQASPASFYEILSGGGQVVSLTISGSPTDLETGFQLAHLLLTEPRIEATAFAQFQTGMRQAIAEAGKNPLALGIRIAGSVAYPDDDVRMQPTTAAQIDHLTVEAAQAWLEKLLGESPIEVAVVGDLGRDRALELVTHYLGSLPARPRVSRDTYLPLRTLKRPAGPRLVEKTLDTPTAQAFVLSGFYGADETNLPEVRALNLAAQVLSTRMIAEIREQAQLVYSIGASSRPGGMFPGFGVFAAGAPTEPHKADALVAMIASMYEKFAASGPTDAELDVAKKQVANTFGEQLKDPGYWTAQLEQMTLRGQNLDDLAAAPAVYQAFTVAPIKDVFAKYYAKANSIVVVVKPKVPAPPVKKDEPAMGEEPGK